MPVPIEVVYDPYVRNAIQAICLAVVILSIILFENFIEKQAEKK